MVLLTQQRLKRKIVKRVALGAAAVELAVVAPLLFLILGGIIEFGQAFRIEHVLSSSCRRGARAATITGATTSRVQSDLKTQLFQALKVKAADVTVNITVNGGTTDISQAKKGDQVAVTVLVPYSKAGVGFFSQTFFSSNLSSTCTFERE